MSKNSTTIGSNQKGKRQAAAATVIAVRIGGSQKRESREGEKWVGRVERTT